MSTVQSDRLMKMRLNRQFIGMAMAAMLGSAAISAGQAPPTVPGGVQKMTPAPDPATIERGGVNFQTSVGSFKMLGGNGPAIGKLKMSFTGTVLVSGMEKGSKIETSPSIRLEIDDAKMGKKVYHGKGTLTFDGGARAIQFFGRDLKARFEGNGVIRIYGEFDKKLETGTFQYDGSTEITPWGTGGSQISVPSIEQKTPKPRLRLNGKVG